MKKILFAIAAIAASASVHASYLYWQIDSSDIAAAVNQGAPSDITGVRIFASNDNGASKTYLNLGYSDFDNDSFGNFGGTPTYAVAIPEGGALLAEVDTRKIGSDYAFYVELINGDVSTWSRSTSSAYPGPNFAGQLQGNDTTYANLVDKGYIGADLSPASMAVWHGGAAYSSVPEPTSAMLMLIGLAGLALRRRAV